MHHMLPLKVFMSSRCSVYALIAHILLLCSQQSGANRRAQRRAHKDLLKQTQLYKCLAGLLRCNSWQHARPQQKRSPHATLPFICLLLYLRQLRQEIHISMIDCRLLPSQTYAIFALRNGQCLFATALRSARNATSVSSGFAGGGTNIVATGYSGEFCHFCDQKWNASLLSATESHRVVG